MIHLIMHNGNPEMVEVDDIWRDSIMSLEKYSGDDRDTNYISSLPSPRILVAHAPATFYEYQLKESSLKVSTSPVVHVVPE